MLYKLYTDGSSYNNGFVISNSLPQLATGAWVLIDKDENVISETKYNFEDQTISYAELKSFFYAIHHIYKNMKSGDRIDLYTDSQYVQKGYTEWMNGWKKRGWKNSSGVQVAQVDIWKGIEKIKESLIEN